MTDVRLGDDLLLVVSRAPIAGQTKTRLGEGIGMAEAALLHRAFLADIVRKFFCCDCLPDSMVLGWAYTPRNFDFATLIQEVGIEQCHREQLFLPQEGDGLGQRLTNLLQWGDRQGFRRTVIMACDSPHLQPQVIHDAFDVLRRNDLVIGRVADGGYYLVGASRSTDVLSRVPMSVANAADALIETAAGDGLTVGETSPDFDVDVVEDLALLVERLLPDGVDAPASFQALKDLGFIPRPDSFKPSSPASIRNGREADETTRA